MALIVGLSVEVEVPPRVSEEQIISVGRMYADTDNVSGMTTSEALEWAFAHPGGVATLSGLGVRWHTIHTGTAEAI